MKMKNLMIAISALMMFSHTTLASQPDLPFASLKDVEFYFASGVGGWSTSLTIEPDGSFSGNYHDSDMGDTGEGYPHGTMYYCDFSGSFTEPVKIDDYTYVFRIGEITLEDVPGEETITDNIRYIASEPYGLEDCEDVYLYLPGKSVAALPEEFLIWVQYHGMEKSAEALPFYGLYNENAQDGFSGHVMQAYVPEGYINEQVFQAQNEGAALLSSLDGGNLPQLQLNLQSGELFQVWDDALNNIWAYLLETLDPDVMDALTAEEMEWIEQKEADIEAEGSAYKGGSLQPYVQNMTAYRWTRDRVYELQSRYGF